jgi:hypothetical protein
MPNVTIVGGAAPVVVECREGGHVRGRGEGRGASTPRALAGRAGSAGEDPRGAEHLNPFTDEERKHLSSVYHITKVRLSCGAGVRRLVTIRVVRKPWRHLARVAPHRA